MGGFLVRIYLGWTAISKDIMEVLPEDRRVIQNMRYSGNEDGYGEIMRNFIPKGNSISPEDENYIQELLEITGSFRTFDAALDEFIAQKGYTTATLRTPDAKSGLSSVEFDEGGHPDKAILKAGFKEHTGRATGLRDSILFCISPDTG